MHTSLAPRMFSCVQTWHQRQTEHTSSYRFIVNFTEPYGESKRIIIITMKPMKW